MTSPPLLLDRVIPARRWLRGYSRAEAAADLRAGATVGVLVIPQAMAYAALAGVPPIAGLYAATVSLVVYAVFGTSRHISVGPVAIDSLLTAAAVAPLARGDAAQYVALASLVALMVGAMQVGAGVLRLGSLVNFLSVPVISGFTSAAALTIAVSQLRDLLGLDVDGSGGTFLASVRALAPALGTWSWPTALLGVGAILVLVASARLTPRVPGPLLVVALFTALVWATGWREVAVVGPVPSGFPLPAWPDVGWSDVRALAPAAAAIAVVSYLESISTGQVFARRTRTRVEPDQELVAVGLANVAAGLVRGFPVAGGFSRGAVNVGAGARSPMSGVVAAVLALVALLVATPLLAHLPKVALAAIVLVAVTGLLDLRGARRIARIRRSDLVALVVTFVATLVLGPAPGLGVGVAASMVLFLRHLASPHMPELGYLPSEGGFRNVERHPVRTCPTLLVLRVDAPLCFASARPVAERVGQLLEEHREVRHVVLDCSAVNSLDYTGIDMLATLREELASAGVDLHLAGLRGPVQDVLSRAEVFDRMTSAGQVHGTVPAAVAALPVTLT